MKKSNKKKKRRWPKVLLVMLLLLGVAAGVFAYKVQQNGGGIDGVLITAMGHDEETVNTLDTFYCVLLGQSMNLTDTIMLAAYNPAEQKASLLSIPRDTFIGDDKNKAIAEDKINSLCQYKYPEKTVAAVAEITGIDVEKYVLIDTDALVEAVDLIGGVYFDVPIDMNYVSLSQGLYINLKKGYQLLDGDKAEQLVRFRHNSDGTTYPEEYGAEDVGRTRTQREFLTALAKQTLTPQNLLKIGDYINLFYENVKTNITLAEIKDYLPYAVKFDTDNLKTGIVPGTSELCNVVWVYIHDEEETEKVVEDLFGSIEIKGEKVKVEILNGTGDDAIGEEIEQKLEKEGFNVVSVAETSETSRTSIINRGDSDDPSNKIKEVLGVGVRTLGTSNGEADITLVVGKDYLK